MIVRVSESLRRVSLRRPPRSGPAQVQRAAAALLVVGNSLRWAGVAAPESTFALGGPSRRDSSSRSTAVAGRFGPGAAVRYVAAHPHRVTTNTPTIARAHAAAVFLQECVVTKEAVLARRRRAARARGRGRAASACLAHLHAKGGVLLCANGAGSRGSQAQIHRRRGRGRSSSARREPSRLAGLRQASHLQRRHRQGEPGDERAHGRRGRGSAPQRARGGCRSATVTSVAVILKPSFGLCRGVSCRAPALPRLEVLAGRRYAAGDPAKRPRRARHDRRWAPGILEREYSVTTTHTTPAYR